jgi:Mitochondrial import 2
MAASESFVIPDVSPSEKDEVDSLPSISGSVLDSESESDSDAQAEWERSLEQLQLLLTMVIVPFAGKYLGRKFAYWSQ